MNDKSALIQAVSAIPCSEPQSTLPPLTCEISAGSLVCLLGQQFSVINNYMQMLAGTIEPYAGSIYYADSLLNPGDKKRLPCNCLYIP